MQKLILGVTNLALLLSAPLAFATEGHDHSHWTSGFIHMLWIGVPVTVITIAFIILKKQELKKTAIKSEEE